MIKAVVEESSLVTTQGWKHRHILRAMLIMAGISLLFSHDVALGSNEGVDLFRQKRVLNAAQTFLEEGKRELARGAHVRAIRVLSQAINKGADPEAFKFRGQAYDFIGESEKAVADFSSYVSARGSDPEGYILRGDAFNLHQNYEKALADFNKAIELDPSAGQSYVGRGIAYIGLEEYELAVKEFRLALQYDSGNTDALIDLGLAYMLASRAEEAKGYFEKALDVEQDPKWRARITAYIRGLDPGATSRDVREGREQGSSPDQETELAAKAASPESGARPLRHLRKPIASPQGGKTVLSGSWQGKYQGYNLRMQFQQSGRNINGVLGVQGPIGGENTFNFIGTFENGKVVASHQSGTNFRGNLTDERRLVGVLTTADGMKIPVELSENQ